MLMSLSTLSQTCNEELGEYSEKFFVMNRYMMIVVGRKDGKNDQGERGDEGCRVKAQAALS
jgi:hypothetical protein